MASVIRNAGNLTLSYSSLSGNNSQGYSGEPSINNGGSAATIFNYGTMAVKQTVFANNVATGGNGYGDPSSGAIGYAGGNASASIINRAGATLATTALALIGGSATGGNGGVGGNAFAALFSGYRGGNGGAASIGILNLGTANGTYGNNNEGVPIGGLGG